METTQEETLTDPLLIKQKELSIKPIHELFGKKFFIPGYQRGYRWKKEQVTALLEDIAKFVPLPASSPGTETWYCLQPLVVKPLSDLECQKNQLETCDKGWFEVIDGQQRLTTIFIILHYLNLGYSENRRRALFDLHYATRKGSRTFLKEELDSDNKALAAKNIDFFHMLEAFEAVRSWFEGKGAGFDINAFESKLIFATRVIWYESTEEDSIAVFTRINIGKIPLTNAELIKALFLNSSNFKGPETALRQLEIASDWDRIEYALQKDSFWYFLNNGEYDSDTRIEYIFDLISGKQEQKQLDRDYFTFDHFAKKFSSGSDEEVTDNWAEVKRYFQTLEEWYSDRELYHKIGFLITTGDSIKDLIQMSASSSKKEFKALLNKKIAGKIRVDLDELEYKKEGVREVLLLHNIQTMLNNEQEDSRFPFDRYKQERWDIEHINAVAEEIPKSEQHQQDWLRETREFLPQDSELAKRASVYDQKEFDKLHSDISAYFNQCDKEDDTNALSNLVLLDSRTNRGYKNAVFPVKRKKIIARDREGTFIPICTKNVFMKYYSDEIGQMTFWGEQDRDDYFNNIKEVLKPYFKQQ